ncbi:MAG TPA: septum formation initiator family protein [Gaiellaceae bacterium]|nr:septum formation initiator family protein [Gaiellaceae bacterium]
MSEKKARRRSRGRIARRWFALGVLVLVALLYYRPLHGYLDARAQRAVRVAALRRLDREQATLERRLHAASSPTVLAAEARALGYIRPGEHLFIVKDIPQWRRRHDPSRRGHGH